MGRKYVLVLQIPGDQLEDYDDLVGLEDAIVQKLHDMLERDGHDFGSGEGNLFFRTDDPRRAFQAYRDLVGLDGLKEQRVAFREVEGEIYEILWPPDLKYFVVK